MKKTQKVWMIIAAICIFAGLCLGISGLISLDFDFTRFNTANTVTNTYEINEKFHSISIDTNDCDLNFVLTDKNKSEVVCFEDEKMPNKVEVKNGVLTIEVTNNRKWYDYIGIYWADTEITVHLPESEYEKLEIFDDVGDISISSDFSFAKALIKTSTGDIDFSASVKDEIDVKTSTGDITVKEINCRSINFNTDTGNIHFSDAQIQQNASFKTDTGNLKIENVKSGSITAETDTGNMKFKNTISVSDFKNISNTGDILFERCDSQYFDVETSTGNVKGTLLSEKIFLTETDTGSIDVPKTASGGKFTVKTDTGDIKLNIE